MSGHPRGFDSGGLNVKGAPAGIQLCLGKRGCPGRNSALPRQTGVPGEVFAGGYKYYNMP